MMIDPIATLRQGQTLEMRWGRLGQLECGIAGEALGVDKALIGADEMDMILTWTVWEHFVNCC
jgi:hypothetical protein